MYHDKFPKKISSINFSKKINKSLGEKVNKIANNKGDYHCCVVVAMNLYEILITKIMRSSFFFAVSRKSSMRRIVLSSFRLEYLH